MQCGNCKAQLPADAVFCGQCGTRVAVRAVPPAVPEVVPPAAPEVAAETVKPPSPVPVFTPEAVEAELERLEKGKKRNLIIGLIALAVLLVLGIVLAVRFSGRGEEAPDLEEDAYYEDGAEVPDVEEEPEEPEFVVYTVILHLNFEGAEEMPPIIVEAGTTIGQMPVPEREGYIFLHWTRDSDGQNVLPPQTEILEDEEFYAQWERDSNWEEALEELLREFLPLFTTSAGIWGMNGVDQFVNPDDIFPWITGETDSLAFHDPVSGQPIYPDTVPFLRSTIYDWGDGLWTFYSIASHFSLYDLDGDGIPELVIYWESEIGWYGSGDGASDREIFRYVDGRFVSIGELTGFAWHIFLQDEAGNPLIFWYGVDGFHGVDFVVIDGEDLSFAPLISFVDHTADWDMEFRNHVTGERFVLTWDDMTSLWASLEQDTIPVPGSPGEIWEKMPRLTALEDSFTESITQKLREAGLVV